MPHGSSVYSYHFVLTSHNSPFAEFLMMAPEADRIVPMFSPLLLDEPVPMLGNITPRRAAKSAKGREKLVAWLKFLENGAARHGSGSPMADLDLTWMWEELGVANLRR